MAADVYNLIYAIHRYPSQGSEVVWCPVSGVEDDQVQFVL